MPPMMKCGHAANSTFKGQPACVICAPEPASFEVDETPPDLSSRRARCHHHGHRSPRMKCESNYGTKPGAVCFAEQPSSPSLPFFEHRPDRDFDSFYCGCFGWD